MRPEFVNAELRIRGYTHKKIAEVLGLSRGAVSTALRTGSSQQVREFVVGILRCDPRDIWPYRYPPEDPSDMTSSVGPVPEGITEAESKNNKLGRCK